MTNQRYDYLDVARGVGILLVVWAHIVVDGWTHQVIYAFHMPLFFFLSGMVFRKERFASFKQFVTVRAKRLLLPYLIYSVVTWGIWALFRWSRGDEVSSYWLPLIETFIARGSGAYMVHNSALWFVPCLFVVELIFFGLNRFNKWIGLTLCLLLATLNGVFIKTFGNDYLFLLPWNLDAALFALPFYGVGNFVVQYMSHAQILDIVSRKRLCALFAVLVMGSGMCYLAFMYGECSMGSSSYLCPIWCFFVRAFLGCFALTLFCALLSSFKVTLKGLVWCGRNSFDVMCIHIPIKGVAVLIVKNSLMAFVVTMAVMIPAIMFVKSKFYTKNE